MQLWKGTVAWVWRLDQLRRGRHGLGIKSELGLRTCWIQGHGTRLEDTHGPESWLCHFLALLNWGRLIFISVPVSTYLKWGDNWGSLIKLWWGLCEIIHVEALALCLSLGRHWTNDSSYCLPISIQESHTTPSRYHSCHHTLPLWGLSVFTVWREIPSQLRVMASYSTPQKLTVPPPWGA